jgi:hypothetical protein
MEGSLDVRRGAEMVWSGVSFVALFIVTLVIFALAIAVGLWLFSVLLSPLPYSDPEAMAAVHVR